uniref:BTB domain-containing protein n=1 Tax=Panagrellus redivivus TaxID=6233 RepID=A0A7E4UV64_PANRE
MNNSANGNVNQFNDFYLNTNLSDATIVVESVNIPAHTAVLAHRSHYFKIMFDNNDFKLMHNRIAFCETSVNGCKLFLKWIYTGTVNFRLVDNVFEVLRLAHMFGITELVRLSVEFLKLSCTVDLACLMLNEAVLLSLDELINFTIDFVSKKTCEILKHDSFKQLSKDALKRILTGGVSTASNIVIFNAVVRWMRTNSYTSANFRDVLINVPFSSIILKNIEAANDVLDIFIVFSMGREQCKIGYTHKVVNENLAVPKYGVTVLTGGASSFFMKGCRSVLAHKTRSSEYIAINLGRRFVLNTLKILIDINEQIFSYWIAVSDDNVTWTRVIDYSNNTYC